MPRRAKELTALDVRRKVHPGPPDRNAWIAAGGVAGLLLQITPSNAKSWLLRVTVGGARRAIGLGSFPEVGLAEARERARQVKAEIGAGRDPVADRKAARAALAAARARLTFGQALDAWIEAKGPQVGDAKAVAYLRNAFARYAAETLAEVPVDAVTPQHVLRVMEPIWAEKNETARKLRMRLEAVLAWAAVAGHRPPDQPNAARWAGNLAELLPAREAVATRGHQPAVAQADLPGWWAALGKRGGMGAFALRFLALTACRSGEVRGARWDEIDMAAGMWTVPAARMKMGREHRVPLAPDALALLADLPRDGGPLVFWAPRGGELSDATMSKVMRDMQTEAEAEAVRAGQPVDKAGWRDPRSGRPAVPHGLRSSFRDWAAEAGIDHVVAELALAHDQGDAVERAYRRSDMVERRRAVMAAWADVLHGRAPAENVVQITGARA